MGHTLKFKILDRGIRWDRRTRFVGIAPNVTREFPDRKTCEKWLASCFLLIADLHGYPRNWNTPDFHLTDSFSLEVK